MSSGGDRKDTGTLELQQAHLMGRFFSLQIVPYTANSISQFM